MNRKNSERIENLWLPKGDVNILDLKPKDIKIEDIVHSTSKLCRYNGYVMEFYSVAQHMVLCCEMAERRHGKGTEIARACLLHDACETYISDIPWPIKRLLPDYEPLEDKVQSLVCQALGLSTAGDVWRAVSQIDMDALKFEAFNLIHNPPEWCQPPADVPAQYDPFVCLDPHDAQWLFETKLEEYGYL
jgi:hypothetical protein